MQTRLQNYSMAYAKILNESMAENSPYDRLIKKIDETFQKHGMADEKSLNAKLTALTTMTQGITATSQEIALNLIMQSEELEIKQLMAQKELLLKDKELELADKRLLLADREAKFNEERAKLIQAQAKSEEARKQAIEREIISYDDKLRMQEATLLKDVVFGYSVGGLNPPSNMTSKMLDAVDKITP